MAQPGNFTPILLYGSSTPTNVPLAANLTNSATGSEIAINVADKNLFFKDSGGVVNTVPIRQSSASSNGWLSSTDWSTFNGKQAALVSGTNIKTVGGVTLLGSGDVGTIGVGYGGTGQTSFTAGRILYGNGSSALSSSANLAYSTDLSLTGGNYLCSAGKGIAYIADATRIFTPEDNVSGGLLQWASGGILRFKSGASTDIARFDTSGNLLVGTTTPVNASSRISSWVAAGNIGLETNSTTTAAYYPAIFYNNSATAGYISVTGTTTAYVSISDYRLKENVMPMVGGLETTMKLNPVTYDWIADKSKGQGFIADELQAIVPDCVVGIKDAVDDNGNPIYQGVDTSFLVATLVAAIQELNNKFDAYVASHP